MWDDSDEEKEDANPSASERVSSCLHDFWISFEMTALEKFYVVRNHPGILVCFVVVFVVLLAAGLSVVISMANDKEQESRDEVYDLAVETGRWFSDALDRALLPLFTFSQFVSKSGGVFLRDFVRGASGWDEGSEFVGVRACTGRHRPGRRDAIEAEEDAEFATGVCGPALRPFVVGAGLPYYSGEL